MKDLAAVSCLLVPLALMSVAIVLLAYNLGELRQMIVRRLGKK